VTLALAGPTWASLTTYAARLTSSTTGVLEAWMRDRIPARDVVLLENGWLDLRGAPFTVVRVPDLAYVLRPGSYAMAAADWIVVPETHFANPVLHGLRLIERVNAQPQTLGGHAGYDYRVYAAPKLAPVAAFDLRPDAPDAAPALGQEWAATDRGPGRRVPRTGGRVYLPPMASDRVTVTIDLDNAGRSPIVVPVALDVDGRPVALVAAAGGPDVRRLTGLVEQPSVGRGMIARVTPVARDSRIRMVRMRLE
jgi:hypothetical protein